jgi:hypothetical protein
MIYYANRDSVQYLKKKPANHDHCLISVAGGLGFMHFLSENTQKLIVVDKDIDNLKYNKFIFSLARMSNSLDEFIDMIKNHNIDTITNADIKDSIFYLNTPPNVTLYYDCTTNVTKCTNSFHWLFGDKHPYSAFYNNESFKNIKKVADVSFMNIGLEELNYSLYQQSNTYVYVSNADWPCFTPSDQILHHIISSMKQNSELYYISWERSLTLRSDKHHQDAVAKLEMYTQGRRVIEIPTYAGYQFTKNELNSAYHRIVHFNENPTQDGVCDCLLYHISLQTENKKMLAQTYFKDILGSFRRIIIIDHCSLTTPDEWLRWLCEINMHFSYKIVGLEFSGGNTGFDRNFILVWDLRL